MVYSRFPVEGALIQVAAWSLILQAEVDDIVELELEQQPAMWGSHGKGSYWEQEWQPGRKRTGVGWSLRGAYLPSTNPRDQVFESEKDLFHLGLESVLKDSVEIKWDGG